jgi:hypothetical protein
LRFEPLFASDRMLIVPRGHELAGKTGDRDGSGRLDVHGLVTREGTGASSATTAVARLREEAGRRVG